jgi:hypothetical protein
MYAKYPGQLQAHIYTLEIFAGNSPAVIRGLSAVAKFILSPEYFFDKKNRLA